MDSGAKHRKNQKAGSAAGGESFFFAGASMKSAKLCHAPEERTKENGGVNMDIRKMLKTLDSLYLEGSLKEAEALLDNSLKNAQSSGQNAAVLTIYNELEGLYRTTGRAGKAADLSEQALDLVMQMGLKGTIHHGTTLLNGATASRAAGKLDRALAMYQEAAQIFEAQGQTESYQMASLYHNISHIYQEKHEYEAALQAQEKAFALISEMEGNDAELATTRVSMANAWMALKAYEKAEECLKLALSYYESPDGQKDGHYGSALAAEGELLWHRGEHEAAKAKLLQAMQVIKSRYGENDAYRMLQNNLEMMEA